LFLAVAEGAVVLQLALSRLDELAAQVVFEKQAAHPLVAVDPALEALIPF
jgi:hypothetical protein